MERLQVDTQGVRVMAARWGALTRNLSGDMPVGLGLPCQPSAAAMDAGQADVAVVMAGLTGQLQARATKVSTADSRYAANEAGSADLLAGPNNSVIGV